MAGSSTKCSNTPENFAVIDFAATVTIFFHSTQQEIINGGRHGIT